MNGVKHVFVYAADVNLLGENMITTKNLSYRTEARIAQWYSAGLRVGWSGFRVPARAKNFSFHHRVQTGSGTHPASYPIGNRGSFPGGTAAGA
jgi:hypothetical protein